MQKRHLAIAAVLSAMALAGAAALQAQASPWIHVQVAEGDGETVHVNLPLSLAQVAIDIMPDKVLDEVLDKVTEKLDEKDIKIADVRRLWNELKDSGDAEFVNVDSDDESVRVARDGNLIRVLVNSYKDGEVEDGEQVRVEIPVSVVDALFSGEGEDLDLPAAIARLPEHRGDIVNVDDGEDHVRVWIDGKI